MLEKLKKEFGNRNKLYEELMKRVMRKSNEFRMQGIKTKRH